MKDGTNGGPLLAYKTNPKKWQRAVDECADQEPLYPPETDPQSNPDYWDQLRTQLTCMTDKGYSMEVREGSRGLWVAPPSRANLAKTESPQGVADYSECEREAFAGKG